jgi:hypothetical protein
MLTHAPSAAINQRGAIMAKQAENLTEREKEIKQELAARKQLRKLSERRASSLSTATLRVHKHYDKLVESYVAQLAPSVAKVILAEEPGIEDIEADEVNEDPGSAE